MAIPKFLKDYGVVLSLFGVLLVTYIGGFIAISGQLSQQTGSLHTKIDGVNKDLTAQVGKVETRATKLEGAVKALADTQHDPLKGLVHDLLASAANALPQKPEIAARAVNVASSLIITLKKEKRSADPEYFRETVATMDDLTARISHKPELTAAVYSTKVSLAEYRSALEPSPTIAGLSWMIFTPDSVPGIGYINHSLSLDQVNFDFSFIDGRDALKAIPPLKGLLSENVIVKNAYVKGGKNYLDGIHWDNVVFIGSRIVYGGGEVELRNVRFVNCVFEVSGNNGGKFVNYAALAEPHFIVPG